MTKEEALTKLMQYCDDEIERSSFFNKKRLRISVTRILEPYQKDANLPLPAKLHASNLIISNEGIRNNERLYEWPEIYASGVKTEIVSVDEDRFRYDKYILFCLENGKILETFLKNSADFKGLEGHFIELYKLNYYTQNQPETK